MEEKGSISIINRTNGQLTGEKAEALPIKLITQNAGLKFFLLGVFITSLIFILFVFLSGKKVVVVDVVSKSDNYKEYKIE